MLLNESLKNARLQFLNTNKIDKTIFDELVKLDFSKTYKYISKICDLYLKGIPIEKIGSLIKDYDKYQLKMEDKDIYHKNYNQIVSDIEIAKYELEHSINNTKKVEKARNCIINENNIYVYVINDFYDAYKKGIGTNWCISYNENWFNIHTKNYKEKFLIVHNDNLDIKDQNSRLCISCTKIEDELNIVIYNKYNEEYIDYTDSLNNCIKQLGDIWNKIIDYLLNSIS